MKLRDEVYKKISTNPKLTKLQNGEGAYLWFINETKIDKENYLNLKSLENWNPDDDKLTAVTSNNAGSEDFAATSNRKKSDGHGKRLDDVETVDEIKDVQGDYKGFDYYKKSKDARWRGEHEFKEFW
ncbi:7397_t:CDS:1 [Acaulospora morrowiae]|uniref:7397_t:CDS:1 n=1 Tax=Acaulospora morrowiae TaxID=94023 RepID=A0A9N9G0H2_9GLOM|nr:7397_t:CDS:1 [Acaulospora morrowiae]